MPRWSLAVPAALVLVACGADTPLPTVQDPVTISGEDPVYLETSVSPIPFTPLVQLNTPTFDNSGQAVHPDVVRFPNGWHGWEYWMAMTPFPKGKEAFENPSILVSHDGLNWRVPDGLTNPLARTPGKDGYNSDPDLSYDPSNDQLILLYREVTATDNVIHTMTSKDGVHWSRPIVAFSRPNHGMVSPTVAFGPGGTTTIWYVDAGPKKCAERITHVMSRSAASASALTAPGNRWSPPKMGLAQSKKNIWHMDVTWIPEKQEYWAVYVAYPGHACYGQDLFFARSTDGNTWTTYSIPFLRHDDATWTANTLYRASVMYDASRDVVQFFVSGAAADLTWHLGYVDYKWPQFVKSLENGFPVQLPATARAPSGAVDEP